MQAVSGFNDVMLEGQTMLAGGLKDLMALLLECLPEGLLQDTKNNKKKFVFSLSSFFFCFFFS